MPPERSVRRNTLRKSNPPVTERKPPKTTNKKLDILVFAVVIAHGGNFFDVSCLQNKESNKQCSEDAVVNLSTSVLTRNIHLYSNIPYGHKNLSTPCKNLQPVFTFSDVIYCAEHSRGEKLALQEELINEALLKPLLPGTSDKLGYIIDNLNSLQQTKKLVEPLRLDNINPEEKYEWEPRPLVTEVYFFNEYISNAEKASLKSISQMPFSGSLLSSNVTEKDDDISGIFIYTYGQVKRRIDITDLSQFQELHITVREKSFSLISLIRKYIEWWNQYVEFISENEIEKNIRKQPFGIYFASQLTHFNIIELSPNGRRITKINNESVYHLINIILNFQTYDVLLSKKIIDKVIDFFSIKFFKKEEFLVQSNFFLNQMCHSFNVDLHIFNNACRTKITQSQPKDYQHMSELSSLQEEILKAREEQASQSQSMEIGGKKTSKRTYKKIKTRKYKK